MSHTVEVYKCLIKELQSKVKNYNYYKLLYKACKKREQKLIKENKELKKQVDQLNLIRRALCDK